MNNIHYLRDSSIPSAVINEILSLDITDIRHTFPIAYKKIYPNATDQKIRALLDNLKENRGLWSDIAEHLCIAFIPDKRFSVYLSFCKKIQAIWDKFVQNPNVPSSYKDGEKNLVAISRAVFIKHHKSLKNTQRKLYTFDHWIDLVLTQENRADFRTLRNVTNLFQKFSSKTLDIRMPQFIQQIPSEQTRFVRLRKQRKP